MFGYLLKAPRKSALYDGNRFPQGACSTTSVHEFWSSPCQLYGLERCLDETGSSSSLDLAFSPCLV